MKEVKFFLCKHCGNLIQIINDAKVPLVCCGEKMSFLDPSTVDASKEKHTPVATINGDTVNVCVGSAAHPMEEEHSILWIYLQTTSGGQLKYLKPNIAPEAVFSLINEKPVAVYAYCNLHGLWKTGL